MQTQQKKLYLKLFRCPHELHYLDCKYLKNKIEEYSAPPYFIDEINKIKLLLTVKNNINKYSELKDFRLMTRKDQLKFLLKEAIQDNPNISASLKKKRGIPDKMESRSLTKSVLTNVLMGGRRKKTIKITKKINNKRNNKKKY